MTGYVVYGRERLRDGVEEWARVVPDLASALGIINRDADSPSGRNTTYRVFELWKEISITTETVDVPQPAKRVTRYVASGPTEFIPVNSDGRVGGTQA